MEAIDKLKQMTAWDAAPAVTEDELTEILASAAVADPSGFAPLAETWTPTYDLNAAAAAAWLIKAARAAALVAVDPPDSGIVTAKIFDNCREMAKIYGRKRVVSVSVR